MNPKQSKNKFIKELLEIKDVLSERLSPESFAYLLSFEKKPKEFTELGELILNVFKDNPDKTLTAKQVSDLLPNTTARMLTSSLAKLEREGYLIKILGKPRVYRLACKIKN